MKLNKPRKIALVANHVKMEDEDALDVLFWQGKQPSELLGRFIA